MAAEYDDFVFLVAAFDFSDRVVGRAAFGIRAIDDVKAQRHRHSVRQNSRDAPVVFVAENHGGDGFRLVISAVVESTDLPMFTTGIIDANSDRVRDKKV